MPLRAAVPRQAKVSLSDLDRYLHPSPSETQGDGDRGDPPRLAGQAPPAEADWKRIQDWVARTGVEERASIFAMIFPSGGQDEAIDITEDTRVRLLHDELAARRLAHFQAWVSNLVHQHLPSLSLKAPAQAYDQLFEDLAQAGAQAGSFEEFPAAAEDLLSIGHMPPAVAHVHALTPISFAESAARFGKPYSRGPKALYSAFALLERSLSTEERGIGTGPQLTREAFGRLREFDAEGILACCEVLRRLSEAALMDALLEKEVPPSPEAFAGDEQELGSGGGSGDEEYDEVPTAWDDPPEEEEANDASGRLDGWMKELGQRRAVYKAGGAGAAPSVLLHSGTSMEGRLRALGRLPKLEDDVLTSEQKQLVPQPPNDWFELSTRGNLSRWGMHRRERGTRYVRLRQLPGAAGATSNQPPGTLQERVAATKAAQDYLSALFSGIAGGIKT